MSVDLDLCRELLRALDAHPDEQPFDPASPLGDSSEPARREQLAALLAAGLVRTVAAADDGEPAGRIVGLSHSGREFLRLARNDTLWRRVHNELASGGAPVTLEMVRARLLEWGQFSF